MNVLLIGACGFLGPHVARALAPRHRLRITDVKAPSDKIKAEFAGHEFAQVDVSVAEQVRDAAKAFRLGLEVELSRLPSKCEVFFILGDCPQGKFLNEKAKRILGFSPKDDVSILWRRG
jgi:nucleoside-diphosphate-sugar epimerase